jgi:hypothetical protein
MKTDPRFPPCPDWNGTDDLREYGWAAFLHFEAHGAAQMSNQALDHALAASIYLVTGKDVHPPIREHWQDLRVQLRRTAEARQLRRVEQLAALAEMFANPPTPETTREGGSKVPTHPRPHGPASPAAMPLPITRTPTPALSFTL